MPSASPLTLWWRDFALATTFLTRLPVPLAVPLATPFGHAEPESGELARAARAMPLAGVIVALGGGLVYAAAHAAGLPPSLSALLALGAGVLLTGALHEDGLADTADGFGGGRERAHKLSIMRKSDIGTYGVAAVVFSLGLRAGALAAIAEAGAVVLALIAAHALARATLPAIMALLPLAREDGLAAGMGRVAPRHAVTAGGLGLVIAWLALGFGAGAIAALAAAAAALLVALIARAQIGGYTGDVLGAAEQAAECAVLIGLVVLL